MSRHKNKGGRPTKLTEAVLEKLKEAFAIDASVEEACFYADISIQTFYNWKEANPRLFDKIQALRQKPILKARHEVVKGIENNPDFAFRYLRSKRKDEFAEKVQVENTQPDPLGDETLHPEDEALRLEFKKKLQDNIRQRAKDRAKNDKQQPQQPQKVQ